VSVLCDYEWKGLIGQLREWPKTFLKYKTVESGIKLKRVFLT